MNTRDIAELNDRFTLVVEGVDVSTALFALYNASDRGITQLKVTTLPAQKAAGILQEPKRQIGDLNFLCVIENNQVQDITEKQIPEVLASGKSVSGSFTGDDTFMLCIGMKKLHQELVGDFDFSPEEANKLLEHLINNMRVECLVYGEGNHAETEQSIEFHPTPKVGWWVLNDFEDFPNMHWNKFNDE